jgi:hypothetical protein
MMNRNNAQCNTYRWNFTEHIVPAQGFWHVFCWGPNLETSGTDENLDDVAPLEAHTRIHLRLTQVMTGGINEGSWRRRDSKGERRYANQYSDIISVTAWKYFLKTWHLVMVKKHILHLRILDICVCINVLLVLLFSHISLWNWKWFI